MAAEVAPITPAAVDALLDELAAVHERVRRGVAAMMAAAGNGKGTWERDADARWQRVRRQYEDCVRAVVTTVPETMLAAERDRLAARLARGWVFATDDPETRQTADEQFDTLLARYEAVCDAVNGIGYVSAEMARQTRLVMTARGAAAAVTP